MAITSYVYQILIFLKKKELISTGKTNSIIEIGEQNWYGDVSFQDLKKTIDNYSDSKNKEILLRKLNEITTLTELGKDPKTFAFDVAKLFDRENHPTYYDNIVIYKSSNKKEEEFKLPTQYIYSKTNLSSEEQKRWDANKK